MSMFKVNIRHKILKVVFIHVVLFHERKDNLIENPFLQQTSPVCFKMENEIERKFYKQLDAKVKTKSKKQKKATIHF